MGTRHRAGIGITEETDCLSLIVSEETGKISIAAFGEIESDVTVERVDERISLHFGVASEKRPALSRATAPLSKRSLNKHPTPVETIESRARTRD
jgi:diadenylate cyclase